MPLSIITKLAIHKESKKHDILDIKIIILNKVGYERVKLFNICDQILHKMTKNIILLLTLLISFGVCTAQPIDLEFSSPGPQFQDADVGSIAFGDIDNDGDLDFIATGKGGPVKTTLYSNDGDGNFTEIIGTPFIGVFGGKVAFEDVDNDDFIDLLITGSANGGTKTVNLYINDGTGNYNVMATTPFEPNWGGEFAFADVDSDGDQDVLMTGINNSDSAFTKLYLNNGSGIFSEVMGTPFEGLGSSSVAFIDIENDNDKDVIIAGTNNNDIKNTKLYTNDGSGNFTLVTNTPFGNIESGDIAIGDSDNDGDQDVLISGASENNTNISNLYINDGTGVFSLLAGTPFLGTQAGASDFADFDNDGDLDLLIIGASAEVIAHIYENQGFNNFNLIDLLYGAYLSSTAIGDIDGDNDLDLIIAGTSFQAPARSTKTYINVSNILSIDSEEILSKVSIYPNPTSNIIYIKTSETIDNITLYTMLGQEVFTINGASNGLELNLSNQASGTYILKLQTQGSIQSMKIIKI